MACTVCTGVLSTLWCILLYGLVKDEDFAGGFGDQNVLEIHIGEVIVQVLLASLCEAV